MKKLIKRLDEIGESISKNENALALLALGSAGSETERIDEYSDLDFFVICNKGSKDRFIDNLDWLDGVHPITYSFKNTAVGHKLLYEDGIFCEFAVFEPEEIVQASFSKGRIVWKREEFDASICEPTVKKRTLIQTQEHLMNEALTNLYVGLGRYHRGEKLSAYTFVQNYAFNNVLQLMTALEIPKNDYADYFVLNRRFETRYPINSKLIFGMLMGYDFTIKSAENILQFLDRNYTINPVMKRKINELIQRNEH